MNEKRPDVMIFDDIIATPQQKVLDHGYVKLVSSMGDDLAIVKAARVSYQAEWRAGEDAGKDEKLLKYMLANRHSTPFEHVTFTWEIMAPIFVFRQWHRHRIGWSYNEESARYSEMKETFYVPEPEHIGEQSKTNKQTREFTTEYLDRGEYLLQQAAAIKDACEHAFYIYKNLIDSGCPRELARGVLPVNTYSKMFATCNLQSLIHFLSLRMDPHAQYEIRVYAVAMWEMLWEIVPVTAKILAEMYNWPTIGEMKDNLTAV